MTEEEFIEKLIESGATVIDNKEEKQSGIIEWKHPRLDIK